MTLWNWLLPGRPQPRRLQVTIVPDDGDRPYEGHWSLTRFRILMLLPALGLVAVLLLVYGAGTLFLEKRQRGHLERRLEESTAQISRIHSLEAQLLETEVLLLKMGGMVGAADLLPDSLAGRPSSGDAARELAPPSRSSLHRGEMEMLRSMPSAWPLRGWITQEFQGRHGPDYHAGMDIAAEAGAPVRAAGEGVVLVAGWNDEYGNFVLLDHGFGVTSLYGHNSHLAVKKEDRVEQGDIIAYSGNTGRSTAPHLHFEIRRNGIPEDPKKYLLD